MVIYLIDGVSSPTSVRHSRSPSASPSQLFTSRAWLRLCVINNATSNDREELSVSLSVCKTPKDFLPLILCSFNYSLLLNLWTGKCWRNSCLSTPLLSSHLYSFRSSTLSHLTSTFHRDPLQRVHAGENRHMMKIDAGVFVCLCALFGCGENNMPHVHAFVNTAFCRLTFDSDE